VKGSLRRITEMLDCTNYYKKSIIVLLVFNFMLW